MLMIWGLKATADNNRWPSVGLITEAAEASNNLESNGIQIESACSCRHAALVTRDQPPDHCIFIGVGGTGNNRQC